ncbi:aldehyde dehydrogenase family protein [Streptomyces virginiae]|uniref:aldehyde dehydrogenase family protein n=1 Tax=Streptomyces virginiae TaxID=1961 RepID=UPI003D316EFE
MKPLCIRHHACSASCHIYGVASNSAHAAFGGYKQSGIGRETHKMMLEHYQQTKNLLVSYSPKKLGFF